MNPYACALGGYFGRVFDSKTLVTLALIACSTWLAHDRVIDAATWGVLITVFGGVWGVASAVATPAVQSVLKRAVKEDAS